MDSDLAASIDHTALAPDTTEEDVKQLCHEASQHGFASVCVMPYYVPFAVQCLAIDRSPTPVCTVIGFPSGAHRQETKCFEARQALEEGAKELDMVINIGALKSGRQDEVRHEIDAIAEIAHGHGALLKVILETCLLRPEEIRTACSIADEAKADYVKTSTGFGSAGATAENVALMRDASPKRLKIKASGGIRDYGTAMAMVKAGADRLGASRSLRIIGVE